MHEVEPAHVRSGACTCTKWSLHMHEVEPAHVRSGACTCTKWSLHMHEVEPGYKAIYHDNWVYNDGCGHEALRIGILYVSCKKTTGKLKPAIILCLLFL